MLTFRVNKCFILSKLNVNIRCRVTVNIKLNTGTGTVILKNSEQWQDTELQLEPGPYPNPSSQTGAASHPQSQLLPIQSNFFKIFIFSRFLYVSRHSLGIIFKLKFGPVFRIRVIFPIRIRTLKNRIRVHQYPVLFALIYSKSTIPTKLVQQKL